MDVRLNQTIKGLSQTSVSATNKEAKTEGIDFEEMLLEQTEKGLKLAQQSVITGASKVFEEMAEIWLAYENLLFSGSDSYYEDDFDFGDNFEEIDRLEELVKDRGYYSVESVAGRLYSMVMDAGGGKELSALADSLAIALKETERSTGELPEALYDALDSASYKLRKA